MTLPSVKSGLKALILDALAKTYTSESCYRGLETGNRYQSIRLGDESTVGFRTNREEVLSQIRFSGLTVLDLGSNLGELSRFARRRGAALVDGIEYDTFFVELANCINAYNDTHRVSFRRGDITNKEEYQQPYDIVLAFSVYSYIRDRLPDIFRITRKLLLLETHKLDGNLERDYISPARRFFGAHRVLGATDWGTGAMHEQGERAVIALARDTRTLDEMLSPTAPETSPTGAELAACERSQQKDQHVVILDLHRSVFKAFDSFRGEVTDFPVLDWPALTERIMNLRLDPESVSATPEYRLAASGWCYWAAFLRGYFEFSLEGVPVGSTTFIDYMRQVFNDTNFDPALAKIVNDPDLLARRIQKRYLTNLRICSNPSADVAPVIGIPDAEPSLNDSVRLAVNGRDELVSCRAFDGYHRVFAALLANRRYLPLVFKA